MNMYWWKSMAASLTAAVFAVALAGCSEPLHDADESDSPDGVVKSTEKAAVPIAPTPFDTEAEPTAEEPGDKLIQLPGDGESSATQPGAAVREIEAGAPPEKPKTLAPPPIEASEIEDTATVVIPVEGMTCENCERFVRDWLKMEDGIVSVSASWQAKQAKVAYDPEAIDIRSIVDHINESQYKAYMPGDEPQGAFDPGLGTADTPTTHTM